MKMLTIAAATVAVLAPVSLAFSQESPASGGVVHVPAFDLPLSSALSPEARAYFSQTPTMPPSMGEAGRATSQAAYDDAMRRYYDMADAQYGRPLYEQSLKLYPVKETVREIGGVPVADYEPIGGVAPNNRNRVLLNLRGGGFGPVNSSYTGRVASIPVANLGKIRVVTVTHKATSTKYPSATEDAIAVYTALLKRYPAKNIGIYGCSAGGMLTAATTAWIIDKGLPLPGAISISGAGMSINSEYSQGDSGYFAAIASGRPPLKPGEKPVDGGGFIGPFGYFAGVDLNDRLANPMTDPTLLAKFPPTMLMSSTRDNFSSTLRAHRALYNAGVDASLHIYDGLPHCFYAQTSLPEARDASQTIYRFFDEHLGR